jgi:hypothetical protein
MLANPLVISKVRPGSRKAGLCVLRDSVTYIVPPSEVAKNW